MSLSKECNTCPFDNGFEAKQDKVLSVCSDPSQRCINLKGGLIDQLAIWMRFSEIAETAKKGSLAFSQLGHGDMIEIMASSPGVPYGKHLNRKVRIAITEIDDSGLHGTVLYDSYTETDDLEKKHYALPQDGRITLLGALDAPKSDSTIIKGELHCGRLVYYIHPDFPDITTWGMHVQEIALLDAEQKLAMRMFATDPSVYRHPAPLAD